jgi:hypothetical protein
MKHLYDFIFYRFILCFLLGMNTGSFGEIPKELEVGGKQLFNHKQSIRAGETAVFFGRDKPPECIFSYVSIGSLFPTRHDHLVCSTNSYCGGYIFSHIRILPETAFHPFFYTSQMLSRFMNLPARVWDPFGYYAGSSTQGRWNDVLRCTTFAENFSCQVLNSIYVLSSYMFNS